MHTYAISFMGITAVARGNSALLALTSYAARYPFRRGPSLKNIRATSVDFATGGGSSSEFISPRAGEGEISISVAQLHTYAIRSMGSTTRVWGASAEDALHKYAAQHPFRQGPVFPVIHVKSVDAATAGLVSGEFLVPTLADRPEISISVERVQ
jgi:hypothetical protein